MSLLGIDYGEKRIGVAITDELNLIAQNKGFIPGGLEKEWKQDLGKFLQEYNIEKIIVGLPIRLDGKETIQTQKTKEFIVQLKEEISVPVETFDERFTTSMAERVLISSGVKRKKRKKSIDGMAAQIMLQSYVDTQIPL